MGTEGRRRSEVRKGEQEGSVGVVVWWVSRAWSGYQSRTHS